MSISYGNPFPLNDYVNPELFCDREAETKRLISNVRNGAHTTLISIRRMGKTGLLKHVLSHLQTKRYAQCVYVDIYHTQSLREFTNELGTAVLRAFPERKSIGKKFMILLKSLRPIISFDALTNEPNVSFDFTDTKQFEHSLQSIFSFLGKQEAVIAIAIDEFQQIANYKEKNVEAMLRTFIQPLKNVRFIFSGSSKHLLTQIFNDSRRPFFSSTQTLCLEHIAHEKYATFIHHIFSQHKRKINAEAINFILDWTRSHTWYTQSVCNRIYATANKNIILKDVQLECSNILKEQENIFYQYRNLLTNIQWNLLIAIAKEEKLYQPSAKKFINKHDVGTPANVQRSLEALLNKEMIYHTEEREGNYYMVYDCFLSRWLQN